MYVANTTGGLMLQTMLYLANHTSRAAVNTLIDLPPAPKSGKYHGGMVDTWGGGGKRGEDCLVYVGIGVLRLLPY